LPSCKPCEWERGFEGFSHGCSRFSVHLSGRFIDYNKITSIDSGAFSDLASVLDL
jgi:hypothetical protein